MTERRPPASTVDPHRLARPLLRVYLKGGVSSMVLVQPEARGVDVTRADVLLAFSLSDDGVSIHTPRFSGQSVATLVSPQTRLQCPIPTDGMVLVCMHLIHPLYPWLRNCVEPGGTRVLDPRRFEALRPAMQSAHRGELGVDDAARLMDDMAAAVIDGTPPPPPLDPRVVEVMRWLDEDIQMSFDQLTQQLDLSPSRLSHLFKEQMGLSFRSYVSWARTMQAWAMAMAHPDRSLTEIAIIKGFADSSHLTRAFKTCFGVAPSKMRDPSIFRSMNQGMPEGRNIPPPSEFERTARGDFLSVD